MKCIVTTSQGMRSDLVNEAQTLAQKLGLKYIPRKRISLQELLKTYENTIIVKQDGWVLESFEHKPFFFHPDTAALRLKAPRDPLLELLGNAPLKILDCTMGLASDSIVMASHGHAVSAIESELIPYTIVQHGLATFESGSVALDQAMRSITPIHTDSLDYLRSLPDKTVDVVYFDPMFSEKIVESENLDGLSRFANHDGLSKDTIEEAKRVARQKIILKAHFRDKRMEALGFTRLVRPNQKFHYGVIEL